MRLTVTPIGAAGASAAHAASAVVDYLEGGRADVGVALLPAGSKSAAYYADGPEGPGRWRGAGAAFNGLDGTVDRDALRMVLEGRHPHTGARLITARGCSQRAHLATGTAARVDADGHPLYSLADTAALLQLRGSDVAEMVTAGRSRPNPAEPAVLRAVSIDGQTFIPDAEITRHLERAARPPTADEVLADGPGDEHLTVAQAARLLGVTPRYVRRLCANGGKRAKDDRAVTSLPAQRIGSGERARYLIRRDDLAEFVRRRKPPVARVGFDLTLTCEKSLSVLALLADGDQQAAVVRAIQVGNDTALAHLDRVASVARRQGGTVHTEGLIVASYMHGTSRALDPHLHHHNVVANAVVDEHGAIRTLDARALYRHAPAAAALATAATRWELRDSGVDWWCRDDGVWEIAGIGEQAIAVFSTRRAEMTEVRDALEARLGRRITHGEEDTVALATRAEKVAVDPDRLRADWHGRAERAGVDVAACFQAAGRPIVHESLPTELGKRLFADLVDPNTGLCAHAVSFDRGDVLSAIVDWSIDGHKVLLPPSAVERLADEFCASSLVAEVPGAGVIRRRDGSAVHDGQDEPMFATVELIRTRAEISAHVYAGHASGAAAVTDEALQVGQAATPQLSSEQAALVRAWCTSGDRVQLAVGRAGTGKTIAMRAVARAWEHAGYRVIGAAVKGEAARQLASDAGIEADTLAYLLTTERAGQRRLDARTVVIVDEASTMGDRDLLDLLRHAANVDATVRLIGDPAQHGSVPAGGMFALLAAELHERTPELSTMRRLLDPGERKRADLLRNGKTEEALHALVEARQLALLPDPWVASDRVK